MRKCKDCGTEERMPRTKKFHGTTHFPRCVTCHRKWNKDRAYKLRHGKKLLELADNAALEKTGWRRCSCCFKKKVLSEFSTRHGGRGGRLHKMCDTCLSKILINNRKGMDEFTPKFWRVRAYSCNSTYRTHATRLKCQRVDLKDFKFIVKPQHLIEIYNKQNGLCRYCGVKLVTHNLACDHAQPISKGGKHHPSNIRITCYECNSLKHTKTEQEFDTFLVQYANRITAKSTRTEG